MTAIFANPLAINRVFWRYVHVIFDVDVITAALLTLHLQDPLFRQYSTEP